MMGLRLSEGVNISDPAITTVIHTVAKEQLINGDLLSEENARLRTTAAGRLTLNAVIGRLLNE